MNLLITIYLKLNPMKKENIETDLNSELNNKISLIPFEIKQ